MNNKINKKGTDILNSFDGMKQVDIPPFFYTRLVARMQNELDQDKHPVFYLRPAFMMASLSCILFINVIFLLSIHTRHATWPTDQKDREATIESFSNGYNLGTTSVY